MQLVLAVIDQAQFNNENRLLVSTESDLLHKLKTYHNFDSTAVTATISPSTEINFKTYNFGANVFLDEILVSTNDLNHIIKVYVDNILILELDYNSWTNFIEISVKKTGYNYFKLPLNGCFSSTGEVKINIVRSKAGSASATLQHCMIRYRK